MNNENLKTKENKSEHSALARILAVIGLLVILGLITALIYSLVTGKSVNVLLMILFCLIVIPCILFVLIWFAKLIK
ncbi:MAG: phosphate ABC transporter substrate-binding protein [Eubacteriales bacterium]|nr:phosphate ABC transporter substrate-binding protein [Eubacteriales bacterium]